MNISCISSHSATNLTSFSIADLYDDNVKKMLKIIFITIDFITCSILLAHLCYFPTVSWCAEWARWTVGLEKQNDLFLCISVQPNPSNKLAIIHILGLLSNLFTTLDISKQDDESGDGSAPPVKTAPPPPGPNPVSIIIVIIGVCWLDGCMCLQIHYRR